MFLALKEMKKDKGRFLLIISIVILISYLVFFLTGLAYGLAKDNTSAVEDWDANQVVLKSGTNSNILSSMIDVDKLDEFEGLTFSPINIGRSVAYKNGSETKENTIDLVLIGMSQDSEAYPEMIEGQLPSNENQALASISLKNEEGVEIGDELVLSMNDEKFEITGFTKDAKFNVSPVIYTNIEMASAARLSFRQTQEDDGESSSQEGQDQAAEQTQDQGQSQDGEGYGGSPDTTSSATQTIPERVAGVILHGDSKFEANDDFDVIEIGTFIQELPGYLAQVLTFGLMIGFLILISTIVLGVFMYIITMQKKQTFGIMKVQGISNGYIAKSVILQTFIVSLIGVAIGLGLTLLSEVFLPYTVPFRSNFAFYGIIAGLILLISLVGAIFSVKGVSKVDPLEVLD